MLPSNDLPVIIDLEASGFGSFSYPIEVGVALPDGSRFCTLVRPEAEWTHWDAEAAQVHRITRDTLLRHGRSARQAAESLNKLLAGKIAYSDGWAVDKPWMLRLYEAARIPMTYHLSPLELIMTEAQTEQWQEAFRSIAERTNLQRHRASNDAWLIQQTYATTRDTVCLTASLAK